MRAREASAAFGIPGSTIRNKINGTSEAKVLNRGNKQLISPEIEDRWGKQYKGQFENLNVRLPGCE